VVQPKASEGDPKPQQDPQDSEPLEGQDSQDSEGGNGSEQEPKTLEELKAELLADPEFVGEVLGSEEAKRRISLLQSDRDTFAHEQTLPLKQQIEQLQGAVTELTKANDPVMSEIERLKGEGEYEEALKLMEQHQVTLRREGAARATGEREASQKILERIATSPEFAELTQEDWRAVYADAAGVAAKQGRNYLTADEYVGAAVRKLREKGPQPVDKSEKDKEEAASKTEGAKKRKKGGGPEEPSTPAGAGGEYTKEQLEGMTRAQLMRIPREKRHAAMARGSKK
jgi:hypothetical protein